MPGSEAVKERIEQLIQQNMRLAPWEGVGYQKAWLTAAYNAVVAVCSSRSNPYHLHAQSIFSGLLDTIPSGASMYEMASEMAAILRHLLADINCGLLTTVENHTIAVTFDDFLDHGTEYLKHGRKNEAAVVAGIVFEDTIRRICRVLGIPENDIALDTLITELTKQDPPVLTSLKAKRARAAAGLRTSAAHARWEEIGLGDVAPVIDLTKELIEAHLA